MKQSNSRIKRFGLEVFSIVFAVLLALGLDSWQEQHKKNKKINRALEDIAMEIRGFTSLGLALTFNERLFDTLVVNMQRHEAGEAATFELGMARPEESSLAWSTSKTTGIASDFERTLLIDLAEVYDEYDRLNDVMDMYAEFMMKVDPNMSNYDQARHVSRYVRRAIFRMKELEKKSRSLLEEYKDTPFVKAVGGAIDLEDLERQSGN